VESQGLKVVAVDPHDATAFRAWHDAATAGSNADRPDPPSWSYAEAAVTYQRRNSSYRREVFVALEDGVVVGAGELGLPLRENPQLAMFEIAVPPERRNRGVGSALFSYVTERVRAEGRSSLLTEVSVPDGIDPADWPGVRFATRHGLTLRNTELRRQLRLPVDSLHLDTLASKAAQRAEGYRLTSWAGACPDEYAEQYAQLKARLSTDAPLGEVEYEGEVWDVARLREGEEQAVAQRRTLYTTIALAPDGTVVGHTQLVVPNDDSGRAFQWDTLVLPEHRGHRLGLALKVANTRELSAAHPEVDRIDTWNAVQNGPMVAVNVELGYRILEAGQEWQRDL
jgi:GNAT superfamily N-acetyltransferase